MNQLPIGSEIVSNASEDLGYKHGDYNGHYNGEEVLYRGQGTHKNGLRADSYSSYISDPGLDKKEILKVLFFCNAYVDSQIAWLHTSAVISCTRNCSYGNTLGLLKGLGGI